MSEESMKGEIFPEMDSRGSIVSAVSREIAHKNKERIHPAVRILVLDPNTGRTLLQFRGNKDLDPHCWDYSGGGHPTVLNTDKPETYKQAAIRELEEEIRLKPNTYQLKRIPGHELDEDEPTQSEWITWFIAEIPENEMSLRETKTVEVEKVMLVSLKHLLEMADGNPSNDNPLKSEEIRPMLLRDLKRPRMRAAVEKYLK